MIDLGLEDLNYILSLQTRNGFKLPRVGLVYIYC